MLDLLFVLALFVALFQADIVQAYHHYLLKVLPRVCASDRFKVTFE